MTHIVRRAVQDVGIPSEDAVRVLAETPAKAIGIGHPFSQLAPGYTADAVHSSIRTACAPSGETGFEWTRGLASPSSARQTSPRTLN